jgi:hypothetical protein
VFHLYVTKIDLRCCICYNDNIRILQVYIFSVSSVLDMFQMFYLNVAQVDLDVA